MLVILNIARNIVLNWFAQEHRDDGLSGCEIQPSMPAAVAFSQLTDGPFYPQVSGARILCFVSPPSHSLIEGTDRFCHSFILKEGL